jgi:hypothetical protein
MSIKKRLKNHGKNTRNCQTYVVVYTHNLLRREMSELIKDLFEGFIDEEAIAKLSTEELEAINKMLTEAGY